jgi:hypothetical protein
MGYITDYKYYENSGVSPTDLNHGSYQYVSLVDIVRNYMAMYTGDDQAVDNIPMFRVRAFAKRAIQELNYDAFKLFRVLEATIDSDLKMVLPHDYVNIVRLSIEKSGVLFPLTESRYPMSATAYTVDSNNDLTFDGSGYVIPTDSTLNTKRLAGDNELEANDFNYYSVGAKYYLEPSLSNINPQFSINRRDGVIDFNSDMSDELVVLEYISDGMENGDDSLVEVHKFFEEYVYRYITREALNGKRGIPQYEKNNAAKRASAALRNSKIRHNKLDKNSLLMVLRDKGDWMNG